MEKRLSNIVERLLQNKKQIRAVTLAVGELIPFQHEQWNQLTQNTMLASALLNIRVIPAEQQCMVCFQKYRPENLETHCPYCKSVGAKILAGEEFYLDSVEQDE